MCREEWVRALSRASRVGDRVSVGAVREVLGDLPDDADVVVAVRDGSGSAAAVGSVLVEHVEPLRGPWRDHARLEVRVGTSAETGSDGGRRMTPPVTPMPQQVRRTCANDRERGW